MTIFFMDSSALVKRYMPEKGTGWVRMLTAARSGNDIAIAQITPIEMMSAIARHYHDGEITLPVLQSFCMNSIVYGLMTQFSLQLRWNSKHGYG